MYQLYCTVLVLITDNIPNIMSKAMVLNLWGTKPLDVTYQITLNIRFFFIVIPNSSKIAVITE